MGKEIITFGDIKIEKHTSYRFKSPIFSEDVDIDNILVSNKICYLHEDSKIKLLHIMPLKTSKYVKCYNGQTKWLYFSVEDDNLIIRQ